MTADTLVIGAGIAGLAAARALAAARQRVCVLEGRDRVGGRILTRRVPCRRDGASIPIELGAEFIHGLPPETWQLIGAAGNSSCKRGAAWWRCRWACCSRKWLTSCLRPLEFSSMPGAW